MRQKPWKLDAAGTSTTTPSTTTTRTAPSAQKPQNCHVSTATWFPLNFNQPKLPCQHSHLVPFELQSAQIAMSAQPLRIPLNFNQPRLPRQHRIATLPTQSPVITRDSPSYGEKQSHWKTAHRTESACLNRWCNGVYIKVWQLLS